MEVSARVDASWDLDGLESIREDISAGEFLGDRDSATDGIVRDEYIRFLNAQGGFPPRIAGDPREARVFSLPPIPMHPGLDILGNVEVARAGIPESEDLVRRWCGEVPPSDVATLPRPMFGIGIGGFSLSTAEFQSLQRHVFRGPLSSAEQTDFDGDGASDTVVSFDLNSLSFSVSAYAVKEAPVEIHGDEDQGRCIPDRGGFIVRSREYGGVRYREYHRTRHREDYRTEAD